jgi:hypothetical protein
VGGITISTESADGAPTHPPKTFSSAPAASQKLLEVGLQAQKESGPPMECASTQTAALRSRQRCPPQTFFSSSRFLCVFFVFSVPRRNFVLQMLITHVFLIEIEYEMTVTGINGASAIRQFIQT